MSGRSLRLGVMPLTDSAPLVVAKRAGFFERVGLQITLEREQAWSSMRDKLAVGALDVAQMLAPMPIAMNLGLDHTPVSTKVIRTLSRNGNAITVSAEIAMAMRDNGWSGLSSGPIASARALHQCIEHRRAKLRFGTVFHLSTHVYQLRNWLECGGIDPNHDVEIITVPPSRTATALADHQIDGFCAGEPWNHQANSAGLGKTVGTSDQLTPNRSEKVLAARAPDDGEPYDWFPPLDQALADAMTWLASPTNRLKAARWLVEEGIIEADFDIVAASLMGVRDDVGMHQPAAYDRVHVFPIEEAFIKRLDDMRYWSTAMKRADHMEKEPSDEELAEMLWPASNNAALHNS